MGIFDGWFDPDPNRGDDNLTPRERKALFEENCKGKEHTRNVVADRGREAEKSALEKWFSL